MPTNSVNTTLHPSVSMFFLSDHKLPRDFEERRKDGINIKEFIEAPVNDYLIHFGHPTEAIMNYFKSPGVIPVELLDYLRPLGTIKVTKKKKKSPAPSSDPFVDTLTTSLDHLDLTKTTSKVKVSGCDPIIDIFLDNLANVLVNPVSSCVNIKIPPEVNTWTSPCGLVDGCNPMCHALRARLGVLELCALIAKNNKEAHIVNQVYTHIDSHMPLLCALSHDRKDMAEIVELDKMQSTCSKCNMEYILSIAEPDLMFAYTVDKIPDLSSLVPLAVAFNKTPTSNKRFAQIKIPNLTPYNVWIVLLLTNVMYKSLPHRCNNRDFYSLVKSACEKDSSMRELMLKIIIASVLGVYKKAEEKMPTNLRCVMYHFFYKPVPVMELINALNKTNNITLLYMGKEFCREICERQPGIIRALGELYEWDIYNTYTTKINHAIRERIWNNLQCPVKPLETFSDLFQGIDGIVQRLHEEYRKSQKENNINYDVYEIIKECTDLNLCRYTLEGEIVMAGQEHLVSNPNPEIPQDRFDLMKEIIETFSPDQYISMDWLMAFGVPYEYIQSMKVAVFSKSPDLVRTLKSLPHDIYAIFYNFFLAQRECMEYREYQCDVHMYYAHMRALHDYHHIREGMTIPRVAGTIQVCPNCGDFKCVSFSEIRAKNKNSKGSGVIMLTGDGMTVCAKTRKAADWREVCRQNAQIDNMETELVVTEHRPLHQAEHTRKRKDAKLIAVQHMLTKCRKTPTKTLRVLGQIVMYRRSSYIGCFKCIGWLKLENAIYKGDMILCQSCFNKTQKTVQIPLQCEIDYCKKRIKDNSECIQIGIYDDTPEKTEDHCFRMMQLCSFHGSFHWIRSGDNNHVVLRKSYIQERMQSNSYPRIKKY